MNSQDSQKSFLQRLIRSFLELLIRGRRVAIDLLFKSDEIELVITSLFRAQVSLHHPGVEGTDLTGTLRIRPSWLGWIARWQLPEEIHLDRDGRFRVALPDDVKGVASIEKFAVEDGSLHIDLTLHGLPEES
ncbi:MAG: hypothetical protein V2A56_06090 [bacterium]